MHTSLNQSAVKKLSVSFGFNCRGDEQDWDVEFANPARLQEFLKFFKENKLTLEEKQTLMSLILASFDEYLAEDTISKILIWNEIKTLLLEDKKNYQLLISYWQNPEFRVSELLFKI